MRWNRMDENKEPQVFGGKVNFAMVGLGDQALKFYQANRFGQQMELLALCGNTMEETLEFAAGKGGVLCFDQVEDLASWDGVEAVFLSDSVPLKERSKMAMTLLQGGKHVLCAAPMASSCQEMESMFQAAQEADCILMEALPSLWAPAFEKMLPYLESLGQVRHATLQNCRYAFDYEQWKRGIITSAFRPESQGGASMELGVMAVSMMIRLFGQPDAIYASGVTLHNGMNISGSILMSYPEMTGEVIYSKVSDSAMPSQIQGENGSMLIQEITNIKDLRISRRKVDQVIHFEQSDNILNHVTNAFIATIKSGEGMEQGRDLSMATMKVLEEARKQLERRSN